MSENDESQFPKHQGDIQFTITYDREKQKHLTFESWN